MIRVTLAGAAVGTGPAAALPPVSVSFCSGTATLLETEGDNRPTVLSLVASGRMKLEAGSITAVRTATAVSTDTDEHEHEHTLTPVELRRAIALIDTPLVAEHSDDVSVSTAIREELAFAGRSRGSGRSKGRIAHFLASAADGRRPFGSLSAEERLRLLIDLAMQRPDVAALVITSPERHGGDPARWWHVIREAAARGIAVLVVTDHATVTYLTRLPHPDPLGSDALPLFDLESRTS